MKEINLKIPLTEKDIKNLKIGDNVKLTGTIFTARDLAHKYLVEESPEFKKDLENGVIYHCGPLAKKRMISYKVVSAGPTTSKRMEKYMEKIIKKYKIKAIIGKGGFSKEMLNVFKKYCCVYLQATGGAGALLAKNIKRVINVYKLQEFGETEAIWQLYVEDFPTIVGMANGKSLYKNQ